eukprot:c5159_g1_i1.p1 GENE.c5159_g1_i1~~c5159_g1_i1.p1  ORF type:complete len:768 (-),score=205.16 c5159_g1_i1:3-2306(-)
MHCGQCAADADAECVDCRDGFCSSCFSSFHSKGRMVLHRKRSVNISGFDVFCGEHSREKEYLCVTHNELVCCDCIMTGGGHESCHSLSRTETQNKLTNDLTKNLKKLEQLLVGLALLAQPRQDFSDSLHRVEGIVNTSFEELQKSLTVTHQNQIQSLRTRHTELLEKLDSKKIEAGQVKPSAERLIKSIRTALDGTSTLPAELKSHQAQLNLVVSDAEEILKDLVCPETSVWKTPFDVAHINNTSLLSAIRSFGVEFETSHTAKVEEDVDMGDVPIRKTRPPPQPQQKSNSIASEPTSIRPKPANHHVVANNDDDSSDEEIVLPSRIRVPAITPPTVPPPVAPVAPPLTSMDHVSDGTASPPPKKPKAKKATKKESSKESSKEPSKESKKKKEKIKTPKSPESPSSPPHAPIPPSTAAPRSPAKANGVKRERDLSDDERTSKHVRTAPPSPSVHDMDTIIRKVKDIKDALQTQLAMKNWENLRSVLHQACDLSIPPNFLTEVLKQTEIGKVISRVQKNSEAPSEITKRCQHLIRDWKDQVKAGKAKGEVESSQIELTQTQKEAQSDHEDHPHTPPHRSSSPIPPPPPAAATLPIPSHSRHHDRTETSKTAEKFLVALNTAPEFGTPEQRLDLARALDAALTTHHVHDEDKKKYAEKLRSLTFNLGKNAELRKQVIDGTILPSRVVTLTAQEMAPAALVALQEKWREQEMAKHDVLNAPVQVGSYKCPSCKNSRASLTQQLQVRSADEPMTCFFTCPDCKHKWSDGGQ